jgi:hypothetical protein
MAHSGVGAALVARAPVPRPTLPPLARAEVPENSAMFDIVKLYRISVRNPDKAA